MLMLFPPLFLAFCGEENASFLIKTYQKHGALLHFAGETATCAACGRRYRMKAENEVEECK